MVHVGDVTFDGLSRATARALLDAADKAGVPRSSVRTTSEGFVVPAAVAEAVGPAEGEYVEPPADAEPKRKPRRSRTKKASAPADAEN